jgi:Family of unknown function (DUF6390)
MSADGALTFARYAFPPNELGYCGPAGARAMLVPGAAEEIERRARQFEGAWVYLEFLAEAMGGTDPLATDVVEAYWLGSDLIPALPTAPLLSRLIQRFGDQPGGTWREATTRARAHHSFQVYEVYPWAAMLQQGLPPGPAIGVLDGCRIRTGIVSAVDGEWVSVSAPHLGWDGQSLVPGPPIAGRARWSIDGASMLDEPSVGSLVSLHWDWVCDIITPEQAAQVETLEAQQRSAIGLASLPRRGST